METQTEAQMENQTIEFSIPSHPQFLQLVRGMVTKVSAMMELAPDLTGNLTLAVDEACSNIIKHSYLNDPKGKIDLCIRFGDKQFEIIITDYGKQCDISQLKPRDLKDIRPGGLGLYIMNKVMDSVTYSCGIDGKNKVIMIKTLEGNQEG